MPEWLYPVVVTLFVIGVIGFLIWHATQPRDRGGGGGGRGRDDGGGRPNKL